MAPLPSWEEIETEASERGYPPSRRAAWLLRASQRPGSGAAGPLLLLWRDDFGWCPFSQQAQFHLEEKGVAYHVRKLPLTLYRLGNRDAEHLSDSPEGLVPALRVLEERCCGMATPKRGAVAIGAADVRAFIEDYCSGPQLLRGASISHCLAKAYLQLAGDLEGRLQGLVHAVAATCQEPSSAERAGAVRSAEHFLLSALEDIDFALSETPDGPYLFGAAFSVVDIAFAPWIDRAAALLGWLCNLHVRGGRFLALDAWLVAMESRPAHRALRLDDETIVRITLASQPALAHRRLPLLGRMVPSGAACAAAAAEAVQCLAACRTGVATLAAQRISITPIVSLDKLLRAVAVDALAAQDTPVAVAAVQMLEVEAEDVARELAAAAIFVRSRVAVPRDMSVPAAQLLRASLQSVAAALVGLDHTEALLMQELTAFGEKVAFQSKY